MRQFSLTRRIILTVLLGQLLLTAGLTVVAVLYARTELRSAFDAALEGRATGTLALVRYTETDPPGLVFDPALVPPPSDILHRDLFEIRASDGSLIARSSGPATIPDTVKNASGRYTDFALGGRFYRAVTLRDVAVLDYEEGVTVPSRVTVIYAASLGPMREHLAQLGFSVAGVSLLLLLIASAVAAWSVHHGLEPLHDLAAQASAISVHHWDFHPPAGASVAQELAPLTGAIETVLHRLKESFRQQRDFTSDAAHELKTSVAIVKSTLQSLLQRPRREEEYRAGLERVLDDCARLEDLLDRMLRLARIERQASGGTAERQASAELVSTCEAAISRIQRLADSGGIKLELVSTDSAGIHLRADPQDLELIWVNMLENAVQYSPAGSTVTLRVQRDGAGMAIVSALDSGPGIPAAELQRVFERFHRGDPSRSRATGGFGLGLAICKALVTAFGGRIEAINRAEGGTEVRVQLPVEPL